VILLGDEIAARVGGYVLRNVVVSVIAAALTFLWLLIFGVPYPLLLAILVALLDLIPTIGSTAAGVLVSLVALTVSLPVAVATAEASHSRRPAGLAAVQPAAGQPMPRRPPRVTTHVP